MRKFLTFHILQNWSKLTNFVLTSKNPELLPSKLNLMNTYNNWITRKKKLWFVCVYAYCRRVSSFRDCIHILYSHWLICSISPCSYTSENIFLRTELHLATIIIPHLPSRDVARVIAYDSFINNLYILISNKIVLFLHIIKGNYHGD